jgi:hypothetical protein
MDEKRRALERANKTSDPLDASQWPLRLALCRERVREGELELLGTSRKHFVVRELVPVPHPDSTFTVRGWRLRFLSRGVLQTTPIEGVPQVGREPTLQDWRAIGRTFFVPIDPPHDHKDVVETMRELRLGYFGPRDSYVVHPVTGKRISVRLTPRGSAIAREAPYFPVVMINPGEAAQAQQRQRAVERLATPPPASTDRSA